MSDFSFKWVREAAGYLQRADLPAELQPELPPTRASVLVPLFWHREAWHLLFIRRVKNQQDKHSGQVAFPGGKRDHADVDHIATATREAFEEIGLQPDDIKVLTTLDNYVTGSNFVVTPVAAIVPWPYPYLAQASEVARIFSIPLAWLGDSTHIELRDRMVEIGDNSATIKVAYYDKYDDEILWGASARMTLSLLAELDSKALVLPQPDA